MSDTNLFEPVTRKEKLLYRIATGTGEIEPPVSRIEKLLYYIAEHSIRDTGIGEPFDETKDYAKGELVIYNGLVYQFTEAKPAGAWDSSKVVEVPIGEIIERIETNIANLETDKVDKVTGKGLSTNDFTDEDKALLLSALQLDYDDFVQIVKLTNASETMAQINARLEEINENGKHVLFDTSALNEGMYLCSIFIGDGKYRVTDQVTGKTAIGTYDGTKTLGEVLEEAIADLVTITVTCQTQDGVTVTGQTVTLRNGTSHEAPVLATKAYDGQPVSFVVAKDTVYFAEVSSTLAGHFNPTTATGAATTNMSVILTYSDVAHLSTFNDIKVAVNAGAGNAIVGVEIDDDWVATNGTVYNNPMVVVDVATVLDADGNEHTAAIMQRKYASLDSIQFDEAEQVLATGNYEASLYYYTQNTDGSYKLLVAGTDYQVGDAIVGTVYKNAIRDTTGNICRYGYNRYRDSAYRQYLNSDAGVGNWWEATHVGDKAPSQLNSVKGYKTGCSADLLAYAKPVRQNCYTNSVTDGSVVDVLCDLFWLPSVRQMAGTGNDNEGDRWKYWADRVTSFADYTDDAGRITYAVENHSTAVYVRLRSASRGYSYYAWYVSSTGYAYNYGYAYYSYRCAPACAIY